MKRDNPEQRLQIAVAQYLEHALKPPTWWSAIGHGGGGRVRGAFLKAMGVKPGIADLVFIHPTRDGPLVVWIELKSEKGDQSDAQTDFEFAISEGGCLYFVARSVDEVEGFLRGVGIPLAATLGRAA